MAYGTYIVIISHNINIYTFLIRKERYSDFLDPDSIEECVRRVQKLIVQVRELACQLRHLIKLFKAFIKWIHLGNIG